MHNSQPRHNEAKSPLPRRFYSEFPLEEVAESASRLFGFYVHIPFCLRRCGYCDFATFEGVSGLVESYLDALATEIEEFSKNPCNSDKKTTYDPVESADSTELYWSAGTTLYVGGGTPTVVDPLLLEKSVALILETNPVEITVEANPDSLDTSKARALASWGVSRVSLGVQSFDPAVLEYLDRTHDPEAIYRAVEALADAKISNFNIDLIYGSPPETTSSWERTLNTAIECGPTHISCYALSVEKGTPLYCRLSSGEERAPDPDDQAAKMFLAERILEDAGYRRYEVSSWSLPGYECLHNLLYWGFGRYRGFGSGAHSFDGKKRYWNPRHPATYIDAVKSKSLPAGVERPDEDDLILDRISTGLRRSVGIEFSYHSAFGRIQRMVSAGLATVDRGRLRPTSKGMVLLNEVIVAVAEDFAEARTKGWSLPFEMLCGSTFV